MLLTEYDYETDIDVQCAVAEQRGKLEGIIEGESRGKLEAAQKMKCENISIDLIKKITGLPEVQIQNL